ncbi:aspartate kinase [Megasphaera cerevisiae DSM 20462]|uniref:Aspartokinase n=1 Tax=Megasphaera cerevisiae DSM 20462 TaxID=1122219 RepID=A0A0J6WX44_9FIRM|nr:aspartate kinase [Megasphaera cerevisiae]KMO86803.1 aspartate kinase [Megasphaera cerevisiae DSM 20462]SJZ35668.1 aspartate kinase [Megasphaera cerevisiae DSM 20462]
MALIVKKFGGSSVATPDKMRAIVQRVLKGKQPGDKVVVVVSAMGDTTDDLVSLAKQITSKTYGREMDMLLSTGEQVSIALMAMAFQEAGQAAISFTGAQAGITTSDAFNKGRILELQPDRIMKALDDDNVVIVAGFQGITGRGDITTLGRGGSDTTAVAIAGAIQADVCEIYTDVDGVYTSDPRVVPNAQKMKEITYGEMLEMAKLGAGVMQPRAVEMGSRFNVPIHVRSTFSEAEGTVIQEVCSMKIKQYLIRGVAQDKNVAKITVLGIPNKPGYAYKVFSELAKKHVDVDMIVQSVRIAKEGVTDITFTIDRAELPAAREVLEHIRTEMPVEDILVDDTMAKVSIVGAGMAGHPGIAAGMFGVLGDNGINIEIISTSEISITCLIGEENVDVAVKAIHAHFFDEH